MESPAKSVFTEASLAGKGNGGTDENHVTDSDPLLKVFVKSFEVEDDVTPSLSSNCHGASDIQEQEEPQAMAFNPDSLVSRLMTLTGKMKRFCKRLVKSSTYEQSIINLDDFAGEVVVNLKELQGLDVTKVSDFNKWSPESSHRNLTIVKTIENAWIHAYLIQYVDGLS